MDKISNKFHYFVGNDLGNSEQDIYIAEDKKEVFAAKNLIAEPDVYAKTLKTPNLEDLRQATFIEKIEKNLIVKIVSAEVKTGNYYIGQYALDSGATVKSIEVGQDNHKSESDIVLITTLAQLAGRAVKDSYKKNKDNMPAQLEITVDMATALPICQYSKQEASKFAKRFMNGLHNVTVLTPDIDVTVTIKFEFVKVLPEGVTATWALTCDSYQLFNKNDNAIQLSKDFFKNKRILHVAIGEGTTEFPITEGVNFNPNFIYGDNFGVGNAINKALPEFKESNGLFSYSRQKFSEVIKNPSHKYYEAAKEQLDFYLEDEAENIYQATKEQLEKANNEVDIICVYGGGSILMREALEKKLNKIADRAKIKLFYVQKEYAVDLECRGLYSFVTSSLFEKVKEITLKKNIA